MTYGHGDERDEWRPPTRPQMRDGRPVAPPGPPPPPGRPRHAPPDDGYDQDPGYDQDAGYDPFAHVDPRATHHYPRPAAPPPTYPRQPPAYPPGQAYGQRPPPPQQPPAPESGWSDPYPPVYVPDRRDPRPPPRPGPAGYPPPGGRAAPPAAGHSAPPATGYSGPPANGYAGSPGGGYPGPPGSGYPGSPGGYPARPANGYPAPPAGGRPGYPPGDVYVPEGAGYAPTGAPPGRAYGQPRPGAPGPAEPAPGYDGPGYPAEAPARRRAETPGRGRRTWADELPPVDDPAEPAGRPGAGRPAPHRGRTVAISVAVVMLLVGATTIAVYVLNQRRSNGQPAAGQTHAPTDDRSIADQKVDPRPLTATEVFGNAKIASTAKGGGTYQVAGTDAGATCAGAVTDQISVLMTTLKCTQVVRATMFSPDHAYVITAGIFNLPDSTAAGKAFNSIRTDINASKGRFMGLAAGNGTDVVTQAQAHLAWDARGHYLTFCVIVLANGGAIAANDARTPLIVTDVLETYLGDTVLGARDRRAATPATSSS